MTKNSSEIEREIRRIEGQLLVAKQICRENVSSSLLVRRRLTEQIVFS